MVGAARISGSLSHRAYSTGLRGLHGRYWCPSPHRARGGRGLKIPHGERDAHDKLLRVKVGDHDRVLLGFGVATCAYWAMRAFLPAPIPPFAEMPDFEPILRGIAPWIREQSPDLNKPDGLVLAQLQREALISIAKAWMLIAGGVAAGALIAARKPAGRWLALGLAVLVLARVGLGEFTVASHVGWGYWQFLRTKFAVMPLASIREFLDVAFSAFSVVFLTRLAAVRRFQRSCEVSSPPIG